jgi:hypothetical protein
MATKKRKTAKKVKPATAFHAKHKDGLYHIVGIGNLRVVIVPDGELWFAQGLEIDYAAQGNSEADVKKQFEIGLWATIQEHLRVHGSIQNLLKIAPPTIWNELLYDAGENVRTGLFSQVSGHEVVSKIMKKLPFSGIQYVEKANAASA